MKTPPSGRSEAHERLRRLLLLVPFVARNPGLSVGEVAAAMGTSREQLLKELDLLTLVGRPPFQPDDFVDISVEDDRVFVHIEQRFSAPPRLTAAEGAALLAAAALLRPAPGDALSKALEKLERVLPPNAMDRSRDMRRRLDITVEGPPSLSELTRAIAERREVILTYFAASRGAAEQRRVRPEELFHHRGHWYLSAHCLSRGEPRLFRLDRVAAFEVTDVPFEAAPEPRPPLRPSTSARAPVRVRFAARAAASVRERFGDAVVEGAGGEVTVLVPGDAERWLTTWVLSFGADAIVVEPAWAVEAVARAARAALQAPADEPPAAPPTLT